MTSGKEESNVDTSKEQTDTSDLDDGQLGANPAQSPSTDSYDPDEAMKAFAEFEGQPIILTETNKRLVKIIDRNMIPLMSVVYGINFLDKVAISYVSIMGFNEGLNLVGDNYQWLGSMVYIGYLVWEYLASRLLQRLPLAKHLSFCIISWGIVVTLMVTATNFAGAVALRLLLGAFEACVIPGFALLTSQWYTQSEQATRINLWFSFNGFGVILGGLLAYGIAVGSKAHGTTIAPWKIVYLATGLLTIATGVLFWWFIPDSQLNARWLNKKGRVLAIERVGVNQQGIGNKHFKMYQFKEALKNPMTWAFVYFGIAGCIPNGGLSNLFSQMLVSFGFTPEQSLLYGTPQGAVIVISLSINATLGARYGQRIFFGALALGVAVMGLIIVVVTPEQYRVARLVWYNFLSAVVCSFVVMVGLIASNIAGYTKKATVAAMYLIGFCVGNMIGPQMFRPQDAPRYLSAQIIMVVTWASCIVDFFFIWWWYRRENARKARVRAQPGYTTRPNQAFLDLTDRENDEFIYSL